jgi:hypothetical protein
MKTKAVPQGARKTRLGPPLSLLAAVAGLITGLVLVGPASAASPVKNGQIRACYKVKGGAKGEMRVVSGKRCKRGERPLTWSVVGPVGATGSQGAQGNTGAQGPQGNPGASGASGSAGASGGGTLGLESQVASLSLEVETLKQILAGVTNAELTDVIDDLPGLQGTVSSLGTTVGNLGTTVSGLTSTVTAQGDDFDLLCKQTEELNEQSSLLGAAFGDIEVLSGLVTLGLPTIEDLDPFTC